MDRNLMPLGNVIDLVAGVVPVDLQTAQTGDYISLKNAEGVLIVAFKGAGTAAQDPDFTLYQATTVAGGSAKVAAVIDTIYTKQGAALTAVGSWTKVTQTASETYSADATSAEEQAIYAIPVRADQLDVANGFDCIRVDVADVGNAAQLGCVLYLLYGLKYPSAPESLPSAIVD